MAFNIDSAVASLNQYKQTFAPEILTSVRQKLELESKIIPAASDGDYTTANIAVTDVFQSFQCGWIPKGNQTLSGLTITQQKQMVNLQWACADIEKMHTEFALSRDWAQGNKKPMDWIFPKWVYENAIVPKIAEEMNINSFTGVYVAPTAGTANASTAIVNGWLKVLADLITAGTVVPKTTAAFTSTNILTELHGFMNQIPEVEKAGGGVIRCSYTVYRLALAKYQADYGANLIISSALGMNQGLALPLYPNVTLEPYIGMGTSSRLIFKPMNFEPMIWTFRNTYGAYPTGFWGHKELDGIVGYRMEVVRGYGFKYAERTWVNNLA